MNRFRLISLAPLLVALAALLVASPSPLGGLVGAQEPAVDTPDANTSNEAATAQPAEPAAEEAPSESPAPADSQPAEPGAEPAESDPADAPSEPDPSATEGADADATPTPESPEPEAESPAEEPIPPADTSAEEPPAEEEQPVTPPPTPAEGTPPGEAPPAAGAPTEPGFWQGVWDSVLTASRILLLLLATIVLPMVLGSLVAKQLRMPDYGWKLSLVFTTLAIAGYLVATGKFTLGPDLGGGFSLVYDLADSTVVTSEDGVPTGETAEGKKTVDMDELRGAIQQRIDPSGQLEVAVRTRGKSVEIIMPLAGRAELDRIKRTLTALGALEFRILVDGGSTDRDIQELIEEAMQLPKSQTQVEVAGLQAKWVRYKVDEFGGIDEPDPADNTSNPAERRNAVKRMGLDGPEILVHVDIYNVTGVETARKGFDINGPQVEFTFDPARARLFGNLTGENVPDPDTGDLSYLGIILDDVLLSAPSIQSRITSHGQISGRNMAEEEVQEVVDILNAGSLPAALNKTPVSEEVISPQLGLQTIQQGTYSMIVSTVLVFLFMLFYYRFAGVVASLALAANLLFVVATMLMINAAFTLPGLAGLVLTVGMSVDANVLIFERIREELSRGASLRMAIRNGFSRATTTIVDANLTTIITAIVLYVIGTDQIRGFAVTLFLGIIMSMYTAIFCSRLVFDIAERKGWIKQISMMRMLANTNWKFMNKWAPATVFSLVIIGLGVAAMFGRGRDLLNIDFTGGTSVYFVLEEPTPVADVREVMEQTPIAEENMLVVSRGQTGEANTTFSVDCSVVDQPGEGNAPTIDAVDTVKQVIVDAFGDRLRTYQVRADESRVVESTQGEGTAVETTLYFGTPNESPVEGAETSALLGESAVDGASYETVVEQFEEALTRLGHAGTRPIVTNETYDEGGSHRLKEWNVRLELPEEDAQQVIDDVISRLSNEPIFPQANKIGGRVAGDMQMKALYAIVVSMIGIIGYVWIRFQRLAFGLAAVAPLLHDVLVTVALLAMSKYIVEWMPAVASALQIESFQIGLTIVAALLTLIGYSINDTIVVFDRIREIKGKSKRMTAEMMDTAINQTLSRTILTAGTTLIVVLILYFFGGSGIHGFAFSLLVGVLVGTYSSVFIAAPLLLWMSKGRDDPAELEGHTA